MAIKEKLFVKMDDDYAGHKKGEVIKIVGKIPPHLKEYSTKVAESTYDSYVRQTKAEKKALDNPNAGAKEISSEDISISDTTGEKSISGTTKDGTMVPKGTGNRAK